MNEPNEYLLGTDDVELARLRFQHQVWREPMLETLRIAGAHAGQSAVDLGSGPGFTTFELTDIVGPQGNVLAVDRSQRFIDALAAEAKARGNVSVETRCSNVEELDLPAQSIDLIYSRWLLSWCPDPKLVFDQMARALAPGGVFAIDEYFDWGRLRMLPHSPAFQRGVKACLDSWNQADAKIDIGNELPAYARDAGLELEHFQSICREGAPGSLIWRWIRQFFGEYVPKLVERDLITDAEVEATLTAFDERATDRYSRIVAPGMVSVVVRRPSR